jgi:hypothetical protein
VLLQLLCAKTSARVGTPKRTSAPSGQGRARDTPAVLIRGESRWRSAPLTLGRRPGALPRDHPPGPSRRPRTPARPRDHRRRARRRNLPSRRPRHLQRRRSGAAAFREQLDARVLHGARDGEELDREQVAAYVAKYACKGSHENITQRANSPDRLRAQRGAQAARADGRRRPTRRRPPRLQRVGRWVHMRGFRGHFVTKSRHYCTTLGELRDARARWRADRDQAEMTPAQTRRSRTTRRPSSQSGSTSGPATSIPATCSYLRC